VKIIGYKPYKKPKKGNLTPEQKEYNKSLSNMRVVVKNSIRRVKRWRIFRLIYRHWRSGKGQINIDNVLTVVVVLSNRQIKKTPSRSNDWMALDWKEL
jgi:hypothetical protein